MSDQDNHTPSSKKRHRARYAVVAFVSFLSICFIVLFVYIWNLLGKPAHTVIPIVTSYAVSEGILDSMPDVEDISDVETSEDSSISTSASASASASSSSAASNAGGQTYIPEIWGNGRVKVYVDSRFPIIKVAPKDPNVENILIIGVDARSTSQIQSRTDSIIVVTIDKNSNAIKLTSFMRDSEVKIPGRTTPTKINAAYVYGGIGLLINTMNKNFDLDIQKFAMVDMHSAATIIDVAGGVTINVTDAERKIINAGIPSTSSTFLPVSGNILLNGSQAVTYGRIRYIGTDTARTQRQRNVLTALITRFKAAPVSRKMKIFEEGFQSFETNMTKSDMLLIAFNALSGIKNIQQYRVPEDGLYRTNLSNYNLIINFIKQNAHLHQFIWGNNTGAVITMPEEAAEPSEPSESASSASSSGTSISISESAAESSSTSPASSDTSSAVIPSSDTSSDVMSSSDTSSASSSIS